MVINMKNVASSLRGTSKISDVKTENDYSVIFRYDERNSDFVRNNFHVLVWVYYSEYVKDWKGNLAQYLTIHIAFATSNDQYKTSARNYSRDSKICELLKPHFHQYAGISISDDINASHFKTMLRANHEPRLLGVDIDIDNAFDDSLLKSDYQVVDYVKKALNALFAPNNYENMMEYMFSCRRIYVVPEVGNAI